MAVFNIAVVSDLHAYVGENSSKNSLLDFGGVSTGGQNPLVTLVKHIREQKISADILVCAGDICNQADIDGFSRAWDVLHEMNDALGSECLIATCGNHDLNSRYLLEKGADDPDPKGALLSLEPSFPFEDAETNNQYWAQNFAIRNFHDECCVVVLNTSAYHGGAEGEVEHGRVSQRTIDAILKQLKGYANKSLYILVCHHHLLEMNGWTKSKNDYEFVRNGTHLLQELEKATRKNWLVIHGHRHHPRLLYGPALSSSGPIIFGSSSLGACMAGVPNQFHLISAHESRAPDHSSIVGTVKTWSWTTTSGWFLSGRGSSGMPTLCGFGFKGQVGNLANRLALLVVDGASYLTWKEATTQLPSLNHLTPEDLNHMEIELRKLGLSVMSGSDGQPAQISRMV